MVSGTVASWLLRSSLDRVVHVRALLRDILLCSWAKHFTSTVLHHAGVQRGTGGRWTSIPSRGSRNTPSRFMLLKLEINAWLLNHLACTQTLPYFYKWFEPLVIKLVGRNISRRAHERTSSWYQRERGGFFDWRGILTVFNVFFFCYWTIYMQSFVLVTLVNQHRLAKSLYQASVWKRKLYIL